jgi:2-polyprenyl-3-methyl-5-hydroxy-6-metoxy-1,4-benzoquinol methylase
MITGLSRVVWTQTDRSRPCPLCGGLERITLSNRMQYRIDLKTVICSHCTLVFTDPPPTQDLYQRFYVEAYAALYGGIAASIPRSPSVRPPQRVAWQLDEIDRLRPIASSRILELGPGKGAFLWWAKERGADVTGLEPSREFAEILRTSGLNIVEGALDDPKVSRLGKFDVVTMFHVLEHFYEPVAALTRIQQLLVTNGLLAIEVPNILKPFRSLDRYFLRYVHLFQYSLQTLRLLLAKCGFVILTVDEGSDDWRNPQSLFVVAQLRSDAQACVPTGNPYGILAYLKAYRHRWWVSGAIRWHVWRRAVGLRSLGIQLGREIVSPS